MTSRSWMFTIFGDWDHACLSNDKIVRAAVQKEKAPETDREHYQGYLAVSTPMRMSGVKTLLNSTDAHLEICKGSPSQSWAYCTKEETRIDGPWTYGEAPKGQGARYVKGVTWGASRHKVAGNTNPPLCDTGPISSEHGN